MLVTRLNWAGILITNERVSIAIDPFYHVNQEFFGEPKIPFLSLKQFGNVNAIFITHIHSDHFDPKVIAETYGVDIPVFVPIESLLEAKKTGLKNVNGVNLGQSISIDTIKMTASFSVDGLGDPQFSWVIQSGNTRLIHCGDTLWHGFWWNISNVYGPFDVVFLPINGAIVNDPDLIPSGQPICMSPEQAVSAAVVMQAKKIVPIHFQAFHNPPVYNQTPKCLERLIKVAEERGVSFEIYEPGESFEI
jgi:L-ascorbate metabolism protein UlaG (beta-lactamase superfamily)